MTKRQTIIINLIELCCDFDMSKIFAQLLLETQSLNCSIDVLHKRDRFEERKCAKMQEQSDTSSRRLRSLSIFEIVIRVISMKCTRSRSLKNHELRMCVEFDRFEQYKYIIDLISTRLLLLNAQNEDLKRKKLIIFIDLFYELNEMINLLKSDIIFKIDCSLEIHQDQRIQ